MQEHSEQVETGVVTGPAVAVAGLVEQLSEQLRLPLESGVIGTGDDTARRGAPHGRRRARGHRAPVAAAGERRALPNPGPMSVAAGAVLAGILGAVFGSFLNVVAYRLPRRESVVKPRSRCPGCGTADPAYDNIPVLSWLLLRGRCRYCGEPISSRYPLVEAGTAVLCAAVVVAKGLEWEALLGIVFVLLLVPITLIDLDTVTIPNKLTGPGALLAIAIVAVFAPDQLPEHLLAAAGGRGLPVPRVGLLSRRDGDGRRQARGDDGPLPGPRRGPGDVRRADRRGARRGALIMARLGVARRAARRRSRSARISPSAASSACSPATRSSTGTSTPSS